MRQIKSIKQMVEGDSEKRAEEVAEFLDRRLCDVNKFARFTVRAKKVMMDLSGDSEVSLSRIHKLTGIMLRKLGEIHPEYQYESAEIEAICNASIFHDIGRWLLPTDVVQKPEKLMPEEVAIIRRHTEMGYEIIRRVDKISSSVYARYFEEVCRYHHERWDGNGYPFGLSGAQIPMYVQVVALVDVYDALISRRDYKPTYSHAAALEMIESGECGTFNPVILDCFKQVSDQLRLETEHYKTTANYKQKWLYQSLKRLNYVVTFGLIGVVVMMCVNIGFFAFSLRKNVFNDKMTQIQGFTQDACKIWTQKMRGDIALLRTNIVYESDIFSENGAVIACSPRANGIITDEMYKKVADKESYAVFAALNPYGVKSNTETMFLKTDKTSENREFTYADLKSIVARNLVEWEADAIIQPCYLRDRLDGAETLTKSGAEELGFYIAIPVFKNEQRKTAENLLGFMTCAYRSSKVTEILNFDLFKNEGEVHIFLLDGTYVYRPKEAKVVDNFYEVLSDFSIEDGKTVEFVTNQLQSRKSGYITYSFEDSDAYGYYMLLNTQIKEPSMYTSVADWCVFVSVPDTFVLSFVEQIERSSLFFYLIIGVSLGALILLVSIKLVQVLRITREMAAQYEDVRQGLELSETRYKMLIGQTKYLVFELDHDTMVVTHTETTASRYGFPMVYKFDSENPAIRDRIHPDDLEPYLKMYHDILSGKESAETNMRLKLTTGEYVWNRCTMHNIYDDEKRAIRSIGFAEDVNSLLKETQHLRDTAMRDSFTGVYNKMYTEILINKELETSVALVDGSMHAFIIMDLDKFKNINDTYGHSTGDMILKNFTGLLSRNARGYDLVGRVGGDEFVYFMQGIRDESAAITKAKTLIEQAHNIGGARLACTISVGIAFSPTDGITYQELYEHADKALYQSKSNGGDTWSVN